MRLIFILFDCNFVFFHDNETSSRFVGPIRRVQSRNNFSKLLFVLFCLHQERNRLNLLLQTSLQIKCFF